MEKSKEKIRKQKLLIFICGMILWFMTLIGSVYAITAVKTSTTATVIPSGYHFAPRYISGKTTYQLCSAPSGYKWNIGDTELTLYKGSDEAVPPASAKGNIWVKYKNVGTYMDETVDMKITITGWTNPKKIVFGKTSIAVGNPSTADGGTSRYVTLKIEYFKGGTSTLFSGLKGHQPIGDFDYFSGKGSEWLKTGTNSSIKFIIPTETYSKFDLSKISSNMIGVKSGGGGGTGSNDGLSFLYLFNNPSHTITWYGGFLKFNMACPDKEFQVNYMSNGGTGTMSPTLVKYGVSTATKTNTFTRTGYQFKEWRVYRDYDDKWAMKKSDGSTTWATSGTYKPYENGIKVAQTAPCGNVYFYAQWTPNTYTVKYNGNGSTGGSTASSSHTYDTAKALTANGFTRTGYTFNGWNTKADGSGTSYTNQQSVKNLTSTNGATINLYAQWKINQYTLTYNVNGGNAISPTSKKLNYNAVYGTLPTPTRTGYTLQGWYTASSGGTKVSSSTKMTASNKTIYAQWKINTYTVTYNANGGSNPPQNQIKTYATALTLSTTKPTKTGYIFKNWNTKADGSGTSYTSGGNYTGNASITLYAQWTPITYTIKYNGNGSTGGSTVSSSHTYDTAKALTTNGFVKDGYTFINWNTKIDGSGTSYTNKQSVKNLTSTNGATVNLYAQWDDNTKPIISGPLLDDVDENPIKPFVDEGKLIIQLNDIFHPEKYISALDMVDGDITQKVTYQHNIPMNDYHVINSGTYQVHYEVVNSNGIKGIYTLTVIVNEPPVIQAKDRYFFLNQYKITPEELLRKTSVFDKEDGDISHQLEIKSIQYSDKTDKNIDYLDTSKVGKAKLTYIIKDSYNKEVEKEVTIEIVQVETLSHKKMRFIDMKYINTLDDTSQWKTNTALNSLLIDSLGMSSPMKEYHLKSSDVKDMKKYISNDVYRKNRQTNQAFAELYLK